MDHILVVSQWERHEYAGFEVHEYWKSDSGGSWQTKKYNDTSVKYIPPTEGVVLSCQCNLDRRPGEEHLRKMYGFKCYIREEMSMTDLEQAEANLKRLKKIWKEYNKLVDLYGNPRTFTQYVSYIASIIGAEIAEHDSVYGDVGYSRLDLASLEYREEKIVNPQKENA